VEEKRSILKRFYNRTRTP